MSGSENAADVEPRKRPPWMPPTHDYTPLYNKYIAWWPYPDGALGARADEAREKRRQHAPEVAVDFYNLVHPTLERGWGHSFHFSPSAPGMSIDEAMVHFDIVLGQLAGLKEGMKVLDVGCGIGGPARTMAKNFNVHVVGVNITPYHVERGTQLNKEAGLHDNVTLVVGDFHHLPFEDNSFDAVYAIQALCHGVDHHAIYGEISRVLKPGALFSEIAWIMTEKFNPEIRKHRIIHDEIERSNGITKMPLVADVRQTLKECNFETTYEEDMELRSKPGPWYWPLLGKVRYATCKADWIKALPMERNIIVPLTDIFYWIMVKRGKVPKEFMASFQIMKICSKSPAIGGREGIFSPMRLFINKNVK